MRSFHIKAGYHHRRRATYYVDSDTATTGIVYQPDVYPLAEAVAELAGATSIIDLGCGWGDKLAAIHERHPDWSYLGVDHGPNIDHCADTYGGCVWRAADLERCVNDLPAGAVVVCADVIEHLLNPRALLATLAGSRARVVVLSTPERDRAHGQDHAGPPPNIEHVREWNTAELCALLTDAGLNVRFAGLTRGHDRQALAEASTVVVVATIEGAP